MLARAAARRCAGSTARGSRPPRRRRGRPRTGRGSCRARRRRPLSGEARDGDPLEDRRLERGRVGLEVADDLVFLHEAEGLLAGVRKARQLALPVRGHEAKRVPSPVAPLVPDAMLLEHDVVDAALLEAVAHREARLPAADDGDAAPRAGELEAHHGDGVSWPRSERRGPRSPRAGRIAALQYVPYFARTRSDAVVSIVAASLEEARDVVAASHFEVFPND